VKSAARAGAGLVAVVPVFNEAATVGRVVRQLRRLCPVIVVDDGSGDDGAARAAAAGATRVIREARRGGKGAALRTGFAAALRMGATAVATLDGDGQHEPADLPRLIAAAHRAPRALVIGNRFDGPGGDAVPRLRLGAIRISDRTLSWLTRTPLRDTQCGFRIYPAALLEEVTLREGGFVLETEALVQAVRAGYPVTSVPVRAIYPPGRAGRFRAVADGARIARYLLGELGQDLGRRVRAAWLRRVRILFASTTPGAGGRGP
jgi:glycosyltransferase involved in cell wall biosynthesis